MQVDIKVLDEEVCRTCPNLDPVRGIKYYQMGWKCSHYDMCYEIQQSIQKQMNEEEE